MGYSAGSSAPVRMLNRQGLLCYRTTYLRQLMQGPYLKHSVSELLWTPFLLWSTWGWYT